MAKRVFVAGHNGMVGRAIVRRLEAIGNCEIISSARADLDLFSQNDVFAYFQNERIDEVYLAAAKVGGIMANNTQPAEFIYENLLIQCNVIHAAHLADVQSLLFLGSSCIYPNDVEQPIREEALLKGNLELTNEPYSIAKIAGIKMCESYNRQYGRDYRSIMPTNLYGSHDNYHSDNSHVIPGLLRRFHDAVTNELEEIVIWGSGAPKREFLHVDDMADASVFVMEIPLEIYSKQVQTRQSHINVGTGLDCTIRMLAETIADITQFTGKLEFDRSKPDGTPRKLLDTTRLTSLGWKPEIELRQGLQMAYDWFVQNQDEFRGKNNG